MSENNLPVESMDVTSDSNADKKDVTVAVDHSAEMLTTETHNLHTLSHNHAVQNSTVEDGPLSAEGSEAPPTSQDGTVCGGSGEVACNGVPEVCVLNE